MLVRLLRTPRAQSSAGCISIWLNYRATCSTEQVALQFSAVAMLVLLKELGLFCGDRRNNRERRKRPEEMG